MSTAALVLERVDVVYGPSQREARERLERGESAEQLRAAGSVVAVENASLEVERNEILVLMGLSGSGKSSLLRCANGLAPVTRGRVLVRDGEAQIDVASCERHELRHLRLRRMAMVFQSFALMPWRTVADNAAFGLELRGVPRAERVRRVRDALELVGLGDWGGAFPHELSGGMQQRVGLARAYVTDADLLLMDEPFSALDPLTRLRLQNDLLDLQRRVPRTIVFVSHDVTEALRLGTRIALLERGRVVQVARPEEIVLHPASHYVREFVSGMNPLEVLRAATVMRAATISGDVLAADGRRVHLDAAGRAAAPAVAVRASALLRDVVRARAGAPGEPILVLDEADRVVGFIGEAEILRALTPPGANESR
jgi:glycine betaine/proline transport system ATP-binding protein